MQATFYAARPITISPFLCIFQPPFHSASALLRSLVSVRSKRLGIALLLFALCASFDQKTNCDIIPLVFILIARRFCSTLFSARSLLTCSAPLAFLTSVQIAFPLFRVKPTNRIASIFFQFQRDEFHVITSREDSRMIVDRIEKDQLVDARS